MRGEGSRASLTDVEGDVGGEEASRSGEVSLAQESGGESWEG